MRVVRAYTCTSNMSTINNRIFNKLDANNPNAMNINYDWIVDNDEFIIKRAHIVYMPNYCCC